MRGRCGQLVVVILRVRERTVFWDLFLWGRDDGCGHCRVDGVALRDGEFWEEANWSACRDRWGNMDGCRACGGGGGEYVPDIFCESADVEGFASEGG
jgi:hypothetical protein